MKPKYLSYAQACAISKDYKHLKGTILSEGCPISLITPAPYSRILQWQFLESHFHGGYPLSTLLKLEYGGRYDVLVASRANEDPGYMAMDLRSLLQRNNVPFDIAVYNCLRNASVLQTGLKDLLG